MALRCLSRIQANERTFLAWLRTSLSLVTVGVGKYSECCVCGDGGAIEETEFVYSDYPALSLVTRRTTTDACLRRSCDRGHFCRIKHPISLFCQCTLFSCSSRVNQGSVSGQSRRCAAWLHVCPICPISHVYRHYFRPARIIYLYIALCHITKKDNRYLTDMCYIYNVCHICVYTIEREFRTLSQH